MADLLGRVPPHNDEAEQSLLGAILIDKEAIFKIHDMLHPDDFYRDAHRVIYEACTELSAKHEPIDILSLANRLSEKNQLDLVGGNTQLATLTNMVPTAAHVVNYAQIVHRKGILRRLLKASENISRIAFEEAEDIEDTFDKAQKEIYGVSSMSGSKTLTPIRDVLADAFDRIDELHREKGKLRGIPTGFVALDNIMAGLQKSDLIIIAARPSVGKSSFVLDMARVAATRHKVPTAIFSLEMSKEQLVDRLLCAEANIDLWKLRTGHLAEREDSDDFARLGHAMGTLSEAQLYIDDTASLNITQIRTKARRLQMEQGLGLVIVDYLQLMDSKSGGNSDNRVQEVAEITRGLKSLARELNVPVIALSQLARAVEQSKPAIPKLMHLRESGSIEQDADIVMFIYRKSADRNYRPEEISQEEKHLAEIHIAKHRNGPTGVVQLFFNETTANFRNLDSTHKSYE
ncbi:MAG: replicative DNA helicase [Candidatus Magasanikbacteria bacterium]|nr:replicative DNA helicase [Candidatus Magasanikbacteria bacterium]